MFKKLSLTILLVFGAIAPAFAGGYAGGLINQFKYDEDGLDSFEPLGVTFRIGGFFNEYVSAEFRYGVGVENDEQSYWVDLPGLFPYEVEVDLEVEQTMGAYFRFGGPATSWFYPYAIVGFTKADLKAEGSGGVLAPQFSVSLEESESSVSYGIGTDFYVSNKVGLNLEYLKAVDEDNFELDVISFGVLGKF